MIRLSYCCTVLFVFITFIAKPQYYLNGQSPFNTKWQIIETANFKVIFPQQINHYGVELVNNLETIYQTGGLTLNHSPRQIPVIVHNRTAFSNGEVAWAPRRMNLYVVPLQDNYFQPFKQHLAIHEFRHVAQVDKLNKSTTRFLYYLLGEQAIGAVLGWHVPLWFLEGDAVYYETASSKAGRGRIPDFTMKLNAQLTNHGIFSYQKAVFGSYKHVVPNHYELGYNLVSLARLKYGTNLWDKVLTNVAAKPFNINAFSKGIKRNTGLNEKKLYKQLISNYADSVIAQQQLYSYTNETLLTKKQIFPVSYFAPYKNGQNIYALKTSFKKIPCFVKIDSTGNEKVIFEPGVMLNNTYSFNYPFIVFNEHKNTRWGNVTFNNIVLHNVENGTTRYLVKKQRIYSSKLSTDNKKIVSVEVNGSLQWFLTVRQAVDGNLLQSFGFDTLQPVQPVFNNNADTVAFIAIGNNGKSLGLLCLKNGQINWVLHNVLNDIQYPNYYDGYLTITAIYNNITNVLKYCIANRQWFAITNTKYGAGESYIYNDTIIYSSYCPTGYNIVKTCINQKNIKPISFDTIYSAIIANQIMSNEQQVVFKSSANLKNYTPQKYSRVKNILNLHSWAPFSVNVDNIGIYPGLSVMSQDALSNSVIEAGYRYNIVDNWREFYGKFDYRGFYPLLSIKAARVLRTGTFITNNTNYNTQWIEKSVDMVVTLPLVFDKGKWYKTLQPRVSYSLINTNNTSNSEHKINEQIVHSFFYSIYYHNLKRTAKCDLQSRWGQVINLVYAHTPFNIMQYGNLLGASVNLYLPGVFTNNGIKIYCAWQQKNMGSKMYYNDFVQYPFGYLQYINNRIFALNGNYLMPLLYPDIDILNFAYIMRLKTNIYYQFANIKYGQNAYNLQSFGTDITADCHFLRFVFPVETGLRYARMLTNNKNFFQFLFSVKF